MLSCLLARVAMHCPRSHGEKHEGRVSIAEKDGRKVSYGGTRDAELDETAAVFAADGSQSAHSGYIFGLRLRWQMR
jgi:hypothetical protein